MGVCPFLCNNAIFQLPLLEVNHPESNRRGSLGAPLQAPTASARPRFEELQSSPARIGAPAYPDQSIVRAPHKLTYIPKKSSRGTPGIVRNVKEMSKMIFQITLRIFFLN